MNTKPDLTVLKREIAKVKRAMAALGPMHPGSLSLQYQACGNPNCKCMHPKHPQRHGPFHKLSYVFRGKTGCRFVRAACAREVVRRVAAYKVFRSLIDRWIELSIQAGTIELFAPANPKTPRKSALKPQA